MEIRSHWILALGYDSNELTDLEQLLIDIGALKESDVRLKKHSDDDDDNSHRRTKKEDRDEEDYDDDWD